MEKEDTIALVHAQKAKDKERERKERGRSLFEFSLRKNLRYVYTLLISSIITLIQFNSIQVQLKGRHEQEGSYY